MIFSRIWERYFLRQVSLVFALFLFCSYALYVLIDYSSRSSALKGIHFSYVEVALYYFYVFIQRADILIPFALLIANIRTLCSLNVQNELVALMASGVRLKTLMRPFLFLALMMTAWLYFNNEFLLPKAMQYFKSLEDAHFTEKYKTQKNEQMHAIPLEDGSLLIYHNFDHLQGYFFDVYWVRNSNDLYRIKHLYPDGEAFYGQYVDHFQREENGVLQHKGSYEKLAFPHLLLEKEFLNNSLSSPKGQSLRQLWESLSLLEDSWTNKEAVILTSFYQKLAMPWLCLLTLIGPAPFCLRFTRHLPVFFIYLISMLSAIGFYLVIHASIVLSENLVLSPLIAVWFPFLFAFSIFGWRYAKLK